VVFISLVVQVEKSNQIFQNVQAFSQNILPESLQTNLPDGKTAPQVKL